MHFGKLRMFLLKYLYLLDLFENLRRMNLQKSIQTNMAKITCMLVMLMNFYRFHWILLFC